MKLIITVKRGQAEIVPQGGGISEQLTTERMINLISKMVTNLSVKMYDVI